AGRRCDDLLSRLVRNVPATDVQCDEIWGFVRKKESHKAPEEANNIKIGDAYCFVAIERHTKLILAWHLGRRTRIDTEDFVSKLRMATAPQRFQITTDGFGPYVNAVCDGLGDRVDFAQLIKV